MNILLDGTVFEEPFTGVANVTLGLYAACCKIDPTMDIAVVHRRKLAGTLPRAMKAERIGRVLSGGLWRKWALPLAMQQESRRIAHFPCNGGIPRMHPPMPVVVTVHDVIPLLMPEYFTTTGDEQRYRTMMQYDLDRADLVITVSENSRKQILQHFRTRSEPIVIRPGVTVEQIPTGSPSGLNRATPYFLYVGGYDQRKGLDQLLRVFNDLVATGGTTADLVIAGHTRPLSGLFHHLLQAGLDSGKVRQTGYIDDRALSDLLRNALALVYPSRFEGFGLPALEAMAASCPVITTQSTSLPEVCGTAALYFDYQNDLSLAVAMQKVEKSVELRNQLIHQGLERARMFSWETSARTYLAALEMLVRSSTAQ